VTPCVLLACALGSAAAQAAAPQGAARPGAAAQKAAAQGADSASAALPPIPDVRLERILPSLALKRPLQVVQAPNDDSKLFLLEQAGRVLVVDRNDRQATRGAEFLDLRERVNDRNNEEGLLSLCFHPDYAKNRRFFVYYTADKPRRSVLSRFQASEDFSRGLPETEEVLLEVDQPYWNHNGGTVCFGPDRMLYLGYGDGGAANDPHRYGQNMSTLLSKIIRIDADREENGKLYAIPKDNPFVGVKGARPEIWALGLRNPWRMAFDPKTGELWTGDVGQVAWEEIDIVVKGGNYGWNLREGAHPFGSQGAATTSTSDGELIDPIAEYGRHEGISVTGGAVWRSKIHPSLDGVYVYGDFGSGRLWGIRHENGRTSEPKVLLKGGRSRWSSIDQLNDGTLVLTSMEGGERGPGALFVLAPIDRGGGAPSAPNAPNAPSAPASSRSGAQP